MTQRRTGPRSSTRGRKPVARHEEALQRAEAMRQRILDAAASLFLKYGYEGTTMARVAKAVDVSAPALYWHFESKTDLAYSFIESYLEELASLIASEVTADEPPEQLAQFVRAYVSYELLRGSRLPAQDTLQRHGFQQLLESLPEEDRRHLGSLLRQPYDMLSEILERGASEGVFHFEDRAVAAQFILTAVDYVFTWYRPQGRFDPSTIAEIHVAIAGRIVGAPGHGVVSASYRESSAPKAGGGVDEAGS